MKHIILTTLVLSYLNICAQTTHNHNHHEKLPKMTLLNHKKVMGDLFGKPNINIKTIGILVYDGFDAMETIAPMVIFSELMGVKIYYIGEHKRRTQGNVIDIEVDKTLDEIKKLDMLIVPGASSQVTSKMIQNKTVLNWIKKIDQSTTITTGIGTGVFLIGKAGLLKGKKGTTSTPFAKENLQQLEAEYVQTRYTHDGKYWTSQQSTAVIDVCLALVKEIAGETYLQAAMLDLEYDPKPPIQNGVSESADSIVFASKNKQSILVEGLYLTNNQSIDTINSNLPQNLNLKTDTIGILVYNGSFTLDFLGPLCVLSQLPNNKVVLIGKNRGVIKSGRTKLYVDYTINDFQKLKVFLAPGGALGTWNTAKDTTIRSWILKIDKQSQYTASVCTGAWILGEAGILTNKNATTHWYRKDEFLSKYGAKLSNERFVKDGKYYTSAGVSAGIDLSFALINDLTNKTYMYLVQNQLNYFPIPPINAGIPDKTDPKVVDMMTQMYDYVMVKRANLKIHKH
jgi:transcriptional regulator GlxA family with amidase domain